MERKSGLMKAIVEEQEQQKKIEKHIKLEQEQNEKKRNIQEKEAKRIKEKKREKTYEVEREKQERASPNVLSIFFKFLGKVIISIFNLIITLIENIWWIFAIIIISGALTIIFNSAGVDINVLIERGKSLLGL